MRTTLNLLIIGLWLWFYRPVFDYLGIIFSREDFRTNQLLLIGVIGLIVAKMRQGGIRPQIARRPQLWRVPLILVLASSLLYLGVERFLDINTISATLFGLGSYGLLGLWMEPRRWREGLPALLLLIGVLPFGEHMQTFIGYPMRILTASIVRDGLTAAGVASIGIDTILLLENGVSQIDLPCSGVKSLWTGMLFLIAASWIERRSVNLSWLLIASLFGGLLFIANLTRIGILVVVGQVANWQLAAEMLHIPLGVLGFVLACAAAVALLRASSQNSSRTSPPIVEECSGGQEKPRPTWLAPALVLSILLMGLIYTPRPQIGLSQAPPTWAFPAHLVTQAMPLKPDEVEWLTRDGAESALRLRFEWDGITGSMILITSKTWRAHHRPERCFEVYGLWLDESHTHLVNPDFPLRFVSVSDGGNHEVFSAIYWFQSLEHTTDDYATRIWADWTVERERWVLVSILFDDKYDSQTSDMQRLVTALHDTVAYQLERGR
jgi:exosortase O